MISESYYTPSKKHPSPYQLLLAWGRQMGAIQIPQSQDVLNYEVQIKLINSLWDYIFSKSRMDNLLESLNLALQSWVKILIGSEDPKLITSGVVAHYQNNKLREFFETPLGKETLFTRKEHQMLNSRGLRLIYDENYPHQFNLRFEKYQAGK